ncbi:acyl-phosphate glycerol 3-phosphate acyltransferase [Coriobacteriaceae bacterium BV3Ac1]|uniref:glycerol-3-phosphate 1-O-acyltransferase PlsY n=1 Tax=Olegusella massiliensis TaxID=1776381 RepID=UPI0003AE573E|nr:glycerol-3-phosphate 1-O-acyltransferase PlsY [Olegusella massiliensis]ERL11946.1 acyl-phosphate glycerol 3-phosphate acyltransferase [Coriobacteriaceae bacterium BV3Ac1]MBS5866141.1 glycerol-3-phosphate 1-O-acyltransferase PlsY [Coriobacteriaceae bacterium]
MTPLMAALLAGMILCYLVCGIPFGLVIAKLHGIDVRSVGSHNIGATNVGRSVGVKAAVATLIADAAKALLCMVLARQLVANIAFGGDYAMTNPQTSFGWVSSLFYLACICGHVFSPYLHFHGGKGISAGFGASLGLWAPLPLGLLVVFIFVVVPTRFVSAGSVAAAASLPFWALCFGFPSSALYGLVTAACIVIWAHRDNIAKLARGEEKKFSFHHEEEDK